MADFEMSQFHGQYTPLVTAAEIDPQTGITQIDIRSQEKIIDRLHGLNNSRDRVNGIFLGSNIGGGTKLPMDLWKSSVYAGLELVDSHRSALPVVVGLLRPSMEETLECASFAKRHGITTVVFAPVLAGDPTKTMAEILDKTALDIILYNNPKQFGGELTTAWVRKTAENQPHRVKGIKDTSGNPQQFEELLQLRENGKFHVFQGDTKGALQAMTSQPAADGLVSAESNVISALLNEVIQGSTHAMDKVLHFIKETKAMGNDSFGRGLTIQLKNHNLLSQDSFLSLP